MTKRELIEALEKLDCPDNIEVLSDNYYSIFKVNIAEVCDGIFPGNKIILQTRFSWRVE